MKRSSPFIMAATNLVTTVAGFTLLRYSNTDFVGITLVMVVVPALAVLTIGFSIRDLLRRAQIPLAVIAICVSLAVVSARLIIRM